MPTLRSHTHLHVVRLPIQGRQPDDLIFIAMVSSEELKEVFGASLALFTGIFWLKTSSNGLLQSISNRWSTSSEICAFLLKWQLKQNQATKGAL